MSHGNHVAGACCVFKHRAAIGAVVSISISISIVFDIAAATYMSGGTPRTPAIVPAQIIGAAAATAALYNLIGRRLRQDASRNSSCGCSEFLMRIICLTRVSTTGTSVLVDRRYRGCRRRGPGSWNVSFTAEPRSWMGICDACAQVRFLCRWGG